MEKELIKFALNVLNLIIARAANDPVRRMVLAQKIDNGEKITIQDLSFLGDETDDLLDQGDRM